MSPDTTFKVLLFAVLREKAGAADITVTVPAGTSLTVETLRAACAAQFPALAPWLPHVKVAVNHAYANAEEAIQPGDEIALIPPVAGG